MEKRPDRLSKTLDNLNDKKYHDIIRFNAFEIKSIDECRKYVSPKSMYPIIKKQRTSENQLSMGAVGCSLSHLKIYKMLSKSDDDYVVIFEDDTLPSFDIDKLENKFLVKWFSRR